MSSVNQQNTEQIHNDLNKLDDIIAKKKQSLFKIKQIYSSPSFPEVVTNDIPSQIQTNLDEQLLADLDLISKILRNLDERLTAVENF
tara:strand:+ start:2466 stop:2726 length:261 start_codon:yes stop_codon:yes gene_type:complete